MYIDCIDMLLYIYERASSAKIKPKKLIGGFLPVIDCKMRTGFSCSSLFPGTHAHPIHERITLLACLFFHLIPFLMDSFERLPSELLHALLRQYITQRDVLVLMTTSRRAYDLCRPYFYYEVSLSNELELGRVVPHLHLTHHLNLRGYVGTVPDKCIQAVSALPCLKTLAIGSSAVLPHTGLNTLLSKTHALRSLLLVGGQISSETMRLLLRMSSLVQVALPNTTFFGECGGSMFDYPPSLIPILSQTNHTLQRLDVSGCGWVDDHILAALGRFWKLQDLVVSWCPRIHLQSLRVFLTLARHLEHLDVGHVTCVDSRAQALMLWQSAPRPQQLTFVYTEGAKTSWYV